MSRTQRQIDPDGGVYHITCRGNDKRRIFEETNDFCKFVEVLRSCKDKIPFLLYHYVLMPNHYHLLLETRDGASLPDMMKLINHKYSMCHRVKYGRCGSLWEKRYWSKLLNGDGHLAVCGPYIELNPVRARLAADPSDWKWSSYKCNVSDEKNALVDPNPYYFEMDDVVARAEYRAIVRAWQLAGDCFTIR